MSPTKRQVEKRVQRNLEKPQRLASVLGGRVVATEVDFQIAELQLRLAAQERLVKRLLGAVGRPPTRY